MKLRKKRFKQKLRYTLRTNALSRLNSKPLVILLSVDSTVGSNLDDHQQPEKPVWSFLPEKKIRTKP